MASLQQIQSTRVLFIESQSRFVRKLQAKGYITAQHQLIVLDQQSCSIARGLLDQRRSFAILADTGNPCFVDPGYDIVRLILDEYLSSVSFVPLGMSSALDAALSMSGLDIQQFYFCGHFPENHLSSWPMIARPLVFYVAGKGVEEWLQWIHRTSVWQSITLYRNIRDRNGGQIFRWKRGDPLRDRPLNQPSDNYVGIVSFGHS